MLDKVAVPPEIAISKSSGSKETPAPELVLYTCSLNEIANCVLLLLISVFVIEGTVLFNLTVLEDCEVKE